MKTFGNDLLSTVNRLTGHLGPVTSLLDGIIERVAPRVTAQACSGVLCTTHYCGSCCGKCSGDYLSYIYKAYSYSGTGCLSHDYTCFVYVTCDYC